MNKFDAKGFMFGSECKQTINENAHARKEFSTDRWCKKYTNDVQNSAANISKTFMRSSKSPVAFNSAACGD